MYISDVSGGRSFVIFFRSSSHDIREVHESRETDLSIFRFYRRDPAYFKIHSEEILAFLSWRPRIQGREKLNTNAIIRTSSVILGLAVAASLAACVPDPYSQKNGSTTNTQPVNYTPNPPPEPMAESAPPAPGPTVYWQPGHWAWTGSQWTWFAGHHEQRPYETAAWEPGHWRQSSNGYFWVDGRWR